MTRSWWARLTLLLSLCGLAVYLLYPTYVFYFRATQAEKDNAQAFCRSLPRWAHCAKLNLGLDLQGGVHLVLGVRVDKALAHRVDRLADVLRDDLSTASLADITLEHVPGELAIVLSSASTDSLSAAATLVRRQMPSLDVSRPTQKQLHLELAAAEVDAVRDSAVEQTIKTLRNRADKLGVTEPTMARRGKDSILIQLPGVKDPERAIDIIGRTAQLTFSMVDENAEAELLEASEGVVLPPGTQRMALGRGRSREREPYIELNEADQAQVEALLAPHVPKGKQLVFGESSSPLGMAKLGMMRTYVVEAHAGITGDALTNAQVQQNPEIPNDYFVTMTFDPEGAKTFERLTEANVGKRMAILLDGRVTSAPGISEKIGGGSARITLGRGGDAHAKFQEAKDLALVLKAGALPAPIEVREKRQVGKSLGQDTVARGTLAMAVGAGLVVVFMALYYRASGMMANLALVLNVLFMLAILAMLEATLTLPGMAGIVLTIGMAVDANVLIFERIREELRLGTSPRAAIDAGYKKAFGTIFDANVTTLIAGVVLMQYGSGPVRGFAVTLIIGLTCSLYTAIVVTRLIHDLLSRRRNFTALSI